MKLNLNFTVAIFLFTASLTIAVLAAIATGPEFSLLTRNVELASSSSANFLNSITNFLPLGFAFTAGMVASVNPCGFSMLPPYLGIFLADASGHETNSSASRQNVIKAMKVGSTVTVSFIVTFTAFGLPIGLGVKGLIDYFPWLGLIVGIMLCATGGYMLNGGNI